MFEKCLICGRRTSGCIKSVVLPVGKGYRLKKLFVHIEKEHGLRANDYLKNFCGLEVPVCGCGCGEDLRPSITSSIKYGTFNLAHKVWNKGLTKDNNESMKRISEQRSGKGNPRYGVDPWNKGLTAKTNEILKMVGAKRLGTKASQETIEKLRAAALRRKTPGHLGKRHTVETIELLRAITAKNISVGKVGRISKTETKFAVLLDDAGVRYNRQQFVKFFSFDFYLVDFGVFVEVDGDYFHGNQGKYDPATFNKTQAATVRHDSIKDEFCKQNQMRLIRIWESEIEKDPTGTIERLLCTLKG